MRPTRPPLTAGLPSKSSLAKTTLTAALLALGAAAAAAAGDGQATPVGPVIGNNKYRATIAPVDDSDDYTGRFLRGETVTVSVVAQKAGKTPPSLKPLLVLVDPDGGVQSADLITSKNGLTATFRNYVINKSGLWAARVSGRDGSTGDYLVSFKVKPLKAQVLRKQHVGDAQPFAKAHKFPGFDGVRLDAQLTWSKSGLPVQMRSLFDAKGAEVLTPAGTHAADGAVAKGQTVKLTGVILSKGAGDYTLNVGVPTGAGTYDLSIGLTPPPRTSAAKPVALPILEPYLDPADVPFIAGTGETVRFTGLNFSATPAPTVVFGDSVSTSVTVGGDGTILDVVVPRRTGGSVVAVYVINPDGQGTARGGYFAFVPPPKITDLVDATTTTQVRSSSALGGRVVRILGENFETTQRIRVGGVAVAAPALVSDTEFRFTMPPVPDGDRTVTITDLFGRVGTSSFTVFVKTPPSFAASPYTPGALATGTPTTLTIRGSNFLASDQLLFATQTVSSTFVDANTRTFAVPALPAGAYSVRLVDAIGTAVDGPAFNVKLPPVISTVTVVAGPLLGTNEIPVRGGSTIQLTGTDFLTGDAVTIGGTTVTSFLTQTATTKKFIAPATTTPGLTSITVTDGAGQSATASNALRYVGLVDVSSVRAVAATSADDASTARGAAADLDRDGKVDDVVIVSPRGNSPGTRREQTRVFIGDSTGKLVDKTSTAVPTSRTDAAGVDDWDAECLAIGDLDKSNGPDVLIGGQVATGAYGPYPQVRLFKNGGAGTFTLDAANSPPVRYDVYVAGYYYSPFGGSYAYTVYGPTAQAGKPAAIAIGDLDKDGDLDVVVGTDHFESRQVYLDPRYVSFAVSPPAISALVPVAYAQYVPATRVYDNRNIVSKRLVDVSASRLPTAGTSKNTSTQPPALHCTDLVLADVDKDGYDDLIVAWNDPTTVTATGLNSFESTGASTDSAHIATRVLLNNRSGSFPADNTLRWMPSPSIPEMWQADRILAADLDKNGYVDLVLVTQKGLDAWTGTETHTRRALRVLTNDGTKFTDVSSTTLPAPVAASGDDWRGGALAVRDVNGDGNLDLVVSTHAALTASGANQPRLRVLLGNGSSTALAFTTATAFCESVATDTGEADDLLFVGDLGGTGKSVLLLLSETAPGTSPSGALSRAQEWKR
ncbi:MAG: FG-GAP-like repeat-containing protein [Planctomycetes bacterium]|nr:FG-GAP-like repeat-containing protein [Planctomycetota bacterium]